MRHSEDAPTRRECEAEEATERYQSALASIKGALTSDHEEWWQTLPLAAQARVTVAIECIDDEDAEEAWRAMPGEQDIKGACLLAFYRVLGAEDDLSNLADGEMPNESDYDLRARVEKCRARGDIGPDIEARDTSDFHERETVRAPADSEAA